ncbi:uncharacterized protein LOC111693523 [Trichogramma pretiosum]|uniref:uncharacterized protein LOC111693523 n=1 Tax=Trichogramma pretiosum TaxID=7493 RepID=UPI000C71BC95|nr:uncharacterized protein LOC111693523 [Trichogramma pretiosum]
MKNSYKWILCGSIATTIMYPLTTVKFYQQMCSKPVSFLSILTRYSRDLRYFKNIMKFRFGLLSALAADSISRFCEVYKFELVYNFSESQTRPSVLYLLLVGGAVEVAGSFLRTPFEVIMRRVACDSFYSKSSKAEKNDHSYAFSMAEIIRIEGWGKLWCGIAPTIIMSILGNAMVAVVVTESWDFFVWQKYDFYGHVAAVTVLVAVTSLILTPFDHTLTIMQTRKEVMKKNDITDMVETIGKISKQNSLWDLWRSRNYLFTHLMLHAVIRYYLFFICATK